MEREILSFWRCLSDMNAQRRRGPLSAEDVIFYAGCCDDYMQRATSPALRRRAAGERERLLAGPVDAAKAQVPLCVS